MFVVGCPRSGTTLLRRMLDSHPLLAVSNDPHFIHYVVARFGQTANGRMNPAIVDSLLAYRAFGRLGLGESEVRDAAASSPSFPEFVSRLYSSYALREAKAVAGEKTPRYVRFLPLLDSFFPWAKFVHIVRDGRDVALSTLDWAKPDRGPGRFRLWQSEPVVTCALSWRWHVTTGKRDGRLFGPARYLEVRYEDLVAEPEATLHSIASFLELPFAPEMLAYHDGKVRREPGLSSKSRWLPPTSGLRDWRTQMESRDVELFEAVAGDLLAALGYDRACEAISREIVELATTSRRSWEAEVTARRAPASRLDLSIEATA